MFHSCNTINEQASSTRLHPRPFLQRVPFVDVLRAFALFGILFIHSLDDFLATEPSHLLELNLADNILASSMEAFIHDKFYIIFSFLFGWGFFIMLRSARYRNKPFVKTYLWRLAILLAIGTLHSFLYWDILQIYAVVGPILLLCRNFGNRQLLTLSILFFLAGTASFVYREQLWQLMSAVKGNGIPVPGKVVQYIVTGRGFMTASMFVLGLYAGRVDVFQHMYSKLHVFRKLALWSCVIALVTSIVYYLSKLHTGPAANTGTSVVESVCYSLQTVSLACFYVSTLALLYCQTVLRKALDWIVPLGRISLTGYLTQSVFLQLFYNFGHGQTMGLLGAMGVTLLFYLAQVVVASLWLSRFTMGPAEWAWRVLTYFKWSSPVKKKEVSA